MRVLQLVYESLGSPFGFGGAGVRTYEIYRRLKRKHEITILCMRYPGAEGGDIGGLRHVFLGTESRSLSRSVLAYTLSAANYVKKYGKNYDIIVENFLPATPFFSRFLTKTPVVLQIQGIMGYHSLRKFNPLYGIPMYLMEKVYPFLYRNFVFVTDVGVEGLMKNCDSYTIIPNGIDRELLSIRGDEDDYILFLSRIDTYTKGLDILMEAFKVVADRFNRLRLILAGYEFDSASALTGRLPEGLRDRVSYAGFAQGDEKLKLLSRAKLFVLPSRHEAHPVSLLEAMACGKALVVSDIPELRYIPENGLGISFKSGSVADLADKLRILLEDAGMRRSLGEKGRSYAARFLWDDLSERFEEFLYRVCYEASISLRGKEAGENK